MLPGVELARRRRTRHFSHSRVSHSSLPASGFEERSSRSMPPHQHHNHQHHHHQHHNHHQHNESELRLRHSYRVGSSSRRTPTIPHEQQLQVFQQESRNSPGSSSSGRNDTLIRETSHQTRLSMLLQGQSENNLRGPALEARDRLDERLRAAALVNHRHTDTSLPRLAEHFFNAVFSDDDEELLWDEEEWEMSMREWLAGQAPSFRDLRQSEWTIGTGRSGNPLKGMSKSDMDSLPREVFQQAAGEKHLDSSSIGVCKQVECSICLESFVAGQTLFCLPCNHRFHPQCLTPWLEGHTQCPYCRSKASVSQSDPHSSSTSRDDSEFQQTDLVSWLSAFETGIHRLSFQPRS